MMRLLVRSDPRFVYEYHTVWTIFVLFRSQTIGCYKKTKPLATVRKMLRYYHITSNQPVKQRLLVTVHWLLLDCVDTALPLVVPRSCRIASQSLVLKKLNLTQQKQTVIWNTKIPQHTTNKKKPRLVTSYHLQPENRSGSVFRLKVIRGDQMWL